MWVLFFTVKSQKKFKKIKRLNFKLPNWSMKKVVNNILQILFFRFNWSGNSWLPVDRWGCPQCFPCSCSYCRSKLLPQGNIIFTKKELLAKLSYLSGYEWRIYIILMIDKCLISPRACRALGYIPSLKHALGEILNDMLLSLNRRHKDAKTSLSLVIYSAPPPLICYFLGGGGR